MALRIVAISTGATLALVMAILSAHAAFRSVVITEQDLGPYEFVYATAPQGTFGAIRRITVAIEGDLSRAGIEDMKPFDVYPSSPGPSDIGFILQAKDLAKALAIRPTLVHRTIAAQRFLTATFPYRSPFSFIVGFWKVDPRLRRYRDEHHLQRTWAATLNQGPAILYLQPLLADRSQPANQ
jgi:hypothetical protein